MSIHFDVVCLGGVWLGARMPLAQHIWCATETDFTMHWSQSRIDLRRKYRICSEAIKNALDDSTNFLSTRGENTATTKCAISSTRNEPKSIVHCSMLAARQALTLRSNLTASHCVSTSSGHVRVDFLVREHDTNHSRSTFTILFFCKSLHSLLLN